ncbi:tRNA (adenosine(37)-N6)-dimethylallyltransferase MiaA [Marinilabiliaceae bacterium ANBcel2]|nr:tRNA (adenosine(37)-N6)-dimethylallyltransferase MiaA [Marinilabiliaceae bacterium ANBcel2]
MKKSPYNLIVVTGPTASGKTSFAANICARIDGEIISGDSRQIYRRMDLGTGKDYKDYIVNGKTIPSHLIDIREPGYKYNVYEFHNDFYRAFEDIRFRNKWPLLCGGTGMYIEAVLHQYQMIHVPANPGLRESLKGKSLSELEEILASYRILHNTTDSDTVKRAVRAIEIEEFHQNNPEVEIDLPQLNPLVIGVDIDRERRRANITERLKERIDQGLIDEVKSLLNEGLTFEDLIYYGLEYKFVTKYISGELSFDEMFERLNIAIHQFAKRQMTWFRGMERRGIKIEWIDAKELVNSRVEKVISMLY